MRKILFLLTLVISSFIANGQTLTVNNYSSSTVYFFAGVLSPTCTGGTTSTVVSVSPSSLGVTFSVSSLSWATTPPSPCEFTLMTASDALSAPNALATPTITLGSAIHCSSGPSSGVYTSGRGPSLSFTWTDLSGGSAQVDIH